MAMVNQVCFLAALLLLPVIVMPVQVRAMDGNASSSPTHVLVALNYPSIRIGPYSWRYFRVEVPPAFAELSILLTRKWTGEHVENQEDLGGKVPMVCFRFGSPPLPGSVLESPQAAAVAAGGSESLSGSGKCAWFHSSSSIALTNMQILAGVWYVGVFSDSQPSRFQSKMISQGRIYTFGIQFTVFGCKTPNLRGHNCDIFVKPLCHQTPIMGLNSQRRSNITLETIITKQGIHFANNLSHCLNRGVVKFGEEGEEDWLSLVSENIDPKAWKYYVLEVVEFSLMLKVQGSCRYCNTTSKGLNETNEASIYVKYGSLPNKTDKAFVLGLAPITILVPRRGLWYIGVHNFNETKPLDFDLQWRVESCSYGGMGNSCALAINSMERVLVEDANESPFNSFYGPIGGEKSLLYSPWFSLSDMTHVGNDTSSNWTYFFVEVPRGASGAVLSVHLRHVVQSTMDIYARLEGFATPENWDVHVMDVGEKKNNQNLALDLVYPPEGIWCIGVQYTEHFASTNKANPEDVTPQQSGLISSITISHWHQAFAEWLDLSWKKLYNSMYLQYSTNRTSEQSIIHEEISTMNQSLIEVTNKRDVQMHISVHGCVNKCFGQGRCTTSYESSRLHFYSYCHCDAAHGGIDCHVPLLVPREETLHIWALIGSNFAALLPSVWAMQHQAYSEWVSYFASGFASGFYHSCDAGGWCALSYDTLQFLDFWLAFLVIVVTCIYVASFKQDIKAVAHVGIAIITAAFTKENATSPWNVVFVVSLGLAGLLLGWAVECWRLRSIPSWLSIAGPARPVIRLDSIYHHGKQLLSSLRARFRWFYLSAGLGILSAAGLSWVLETADTYWIWHSLWHVAIYASAFLILCSSSKPETPAVNTERYERGNLQQGSDSEALPILKHTVELDAFATDRSLDD